ncbi:hypothetical protein CDAR_430411 [Caerostris darwini]|uniref:Uncharacterized protein n=1 Tax=Caerostris darwini TaxID=1538125 RepID=A0AAV4SPT1_9ARAC|nr:hypothetical protein CDAR_430411 [Caerostris darwini]
MDGIVIFRSPLFRQPRLLRPPRRLPAQLDPPLSGGTIAARVNGWHCYFPVAPLQAASSSAAALASSCTTVPSSVRLTLTRHIPSDGAPFINIDFTSCGQRRRASPNGYSYFAKDRFLQYVPVLHRE